MSQTLDHWLVSLNSIGRAFYHYAADAFIQSALLVIVLFTLDLLLRRRVRGVVRYSVWLLVLVKLVLPPTLALPTGIGYWLGNRPSAVAPELQGSPETVGFEPAGPPRPEPLQASIEIPGSRLPAPAGESEGLVTPAASSLPPVTWQAILLLFWVAGVVAFAALLAQRLRFVKGLVAASTPAGPELLGLLEQCRGQIGIRREVGLRMLDTLPSPAVCGLLRPTILVPAPLVERLPPEGLRAALIHELAHIKRADLWINAVQTVLQVIYFYNPFVWLANAMIRGTCEEAVDETVLVTLGGRAREYSNTLINIGEMAFWKADFGLRLVGVAESKRALKRRIRHMVTRPVPHSAKIGALGTLAILVIAAVLLPMARGERSSQEASTPAAAALAEAGETTSPAEANDVIVDPNTGVKFVLAKTFSGANDVIPHVNKLILSRDARFLVHWGKVLPLDGTKTFRYTERPGDVRDVAVSPNGRYIAHGQNAVWLQPVSPETLRPDGPAKKLLDLEGGSLAGWYRPLRWTRDSKVVFFKTNDAEGGSHQYAFSAATGTPVSYPDAVSTGLLSPDGKCVALTLTDPRGGFWVKPVGNGAARLLCEAEPGPSCWSKDGHWLIGVQPWGGARFVSYPEGKEYYLPLPKKLAEDGSASGVGPSADRSRLFFYQASTKLTYGVRVASAEGTALSEVEVGPSYRLEGFQWAPDGRTVFHHAWTEQGASSPERETGLFASSFTGDKPVPFTLKPAVSAKATLLSVSPDNKWLLFTSARESGSSTVDLNVIPLSMADHKASGPATVVLRITPPASRNSLTPVWSPDSTRAALTGKADPADEQDIWVVLADGRTPIRLTRTAAIERDLKWSPDGKMLAFLSDDAGVRELKVVPTAGGDAVVIRKYAPLWGWSPDSKSLTIAEEGMLVRQPLSGGKAEPIVNLKEFGIEALTWQGWSPDGSRLALSCWKQPAEAPLTSCGQLLFARVEGGRLQQTGATDLGPATLTRSYAWSPDGTHVAYEYEGLAAVRPEGRLYKVAVDDIVERINAGAIPPVRPKAGEPAVTEGPSESESRPQLEPITGPVFSDNFDNGLSKYWQFVPVNPKGSPPPAHAVENGQLMLLNSSACLNQIDWADYLVTVRICVKEGAAPGQAAMAILARATPSSFGIEDGDQYAFVVYTAPTGSFWLELVYRHASGARYAAVLSRNPCTLVRDKWYKVAFEVRGEHLRGYLDDKLVMEAMDARLSQGPVWISAARSPVLFDDFSVRRLP